MRPRSVAGAAGRIVMAALALGAVVATPPVTPEASAQQRSIASWTDDRTELVEGSVVTILVDEYTLASANTDLLEAQGHIRDVGLTGGTAGARMGGGVRTTNDVEDSRYGDTRRQDRFRAEITARVVEVTPAAVRVEGTKTLSIDEHEQEVTISGWIRTQDVTADNTVDSWRLADARVSYGSNGELGKTGGFWSKILGLIIP